MATTTVAMSYEDSIPKLDPNQTFITCHDKAAQLLWGLAADSWSKANLRLPSQPQKTSCRHTRQSTLLASISQTLTVRTFCSSRRQTDGYLPRQLVESRRQVQDDRRGLRRADAVHLRLHRQRRHHGNNAVTIAVLRKDPDRAVSSTNWLLQTLALVDTIYLAAR